MCASRSVPTSLENSIVKELLPCNTIKSAAMCTCSDKTKNRKKR